MSFEAEAGPVCRATEPDPQGGATISNQSSIRKHSTRGLKGEYHTGATQENEKDAGEGSGVDLNPGEGRSGCGDAKDKCRCVNSGEKVQEESGDSPSKTDASHSDCSSENSSPTPSCRICFQGAEQGELLNPCRCDGSVRYTHQHCLLKWISERGSWTCELCCYRYQVIAIKMKRPCQWQAITITLVEKVQIIAVFLGSLFLVASVNWLLWSAFSPNAVWQRRDVLFQICYGMYGFMDLVCIGLIIHEGAAVYNVFKRWRAVNLHWDVQNYDKTTDVEENSSHGESSASRTLWLPLTSFRPTSSTPPTQIRSHRHHCGYCIRHLCARSTSQEVSSEDNSSGEVVIRVTSV
ncbi:E3 ubiquitin-protein ligase MARCHF11-like [Acipenser oxyrinchus oxyrinchus]|uniref:RING-type E3 ubiquitin transferase n=1 Tax=Acipenser oxyrinchus oxyrinchus TaxID=40147 RepID=A0AAD8GH52_ACIOX|nr:E3 ubiquitin-protein ligase MARCHF11-like [Acipenser oxyrinchus oxyrinchus]